MSESNHLPSEIIATDSQTLEALRGSIAKWERIAEGTATNGGTSDCPLCAIFWNFSCEGCPVMKATGKPFCRDTPLRDHCAARYNDRSDELKATALRELEFLKSLLPTGGTNE